MSFLGFTSTRQTEGKTDGRTDRQTTVKQQAPGGEDLKMVYREWVDKVI